MVWNLNRIQRKPLGIKTLYGKILVNPNILKVERNLSDRENERHNKKNWGDTQWIVFCWSRPHRKWHKNWDGEN